MDILQAKIFANNVALSYILTSEITDLVVVIYAKECVKENMENKFNNQLKIYTFTDEGQVNVAFRISDNVVMKTVFPMSEFETIYNAWTTDRKIQGFESSNGKMWLEDRESYAQWEIGSYVFRLDISEVDNIMQQFDNRNL